ncbi:MAG: hypothetical protein H0V17_04430 [Deltaproteobacteria bacterium]|nr:hypothetical protein [Deltaproteobacteria bacterium]
MLLPFVCVLPILGCGGQGSFDLELVLPQDPALRPTGMTTVTVTLTSGDQPPVSTTSVLDDNQFSAGDLAVANDVRIEVQLRDVSNRLVGVGEAADLIDIVANESTAVSIPVRRPFVYASNGTSLFSFDPTLDATDSDFQGQLLGVTGPQVAVSVGGDRLAIVSSSTITVFATDTNKPVGTAIQLQGTTRDAAYVPGTRKIAIASDQGIAIVDIDSGAIQSTLIAGVDRITVGPAADGRLRAHGLIGRVAPTINPLATCSGTSMIVSIDVGAPPATATAIALPDAVSDLAAAPENVGLFATLPCAGKVARITGDLDGGTPTFEDFAMLPRASVLAVAAGRVIAAGTAPSDPTCSPSCQPTSSTACSGPQPASKVNFVEAGAHLVVLSSPIAGGMPITIDLPDRRETLIDSDDPADGHAQVLRPFGAVPVDLVALPGGQHVGIVTSSNYYIEELTDQGTGITILPCLNATTADWLLLDLASSSIASRVRSSCTLVVGQADLFPNWECDVPPPGEQSAFGEYVPISVGALFGAR